MLLDVFRLEISPEPFYQTDLYNDLKIALARENLLTTEQVETVLSKNYSLSCWTEGRKQKLTYKLAPKKENEMVPPHITAKRFWMIFGDTDKVRGPTVMHETEISAVEEAKRLAAKHPGGIFYVLESLRGYQSFYESKVNKDKISIVPVPIYS